MLFDSKTINKMPIDGRPVDKMTYLKKQLKN